MYPRIRMNKVLKVSVLFYLVIAMANAETIVQPIMISNDLSNEIGIVVKSELEAFSEKLSKSLNEKLISSHLKIVLELESLGEKIEATQKQLTKMDMLIGNIAELVDQKLTISESKVLNFVMSQHQIIHQNHEEITLLVSNLSNSIDRNMMACDQPTQHNQTERITATQIPIERDFPTRVILEELSDNSGTIEFYGAADPDLQRQIWVLQDQEQTYVSNAIFEMEENHLGPNAYLTIWSDLTLPGRGHLYNGSKGDWRGERKSEGHIILLTLTMRTPQSPGNHPHFKLRYTASMGPSGYSAFSSEVITKNGMQVVSYPPQNAVNYHPWSVFLAVIAPPSGRTFRVTLKYLDAPGTLPDCQTSLYVYFIQEDPSEILFEKQPESLVRQCGQPGNISEVIGHSKLAIIRFICYETSYTGRGFSMEVEPRDSLV